MIANVQYRFRKMAISDNLKKLRKHRGLTQGVLAELAGVELTQISRIERGASEPKLETIKNLANALNCSSDDLIMDDSKEQPYYVKRTIERIHELTPLRQFVLLDLIDAYCDKYQFSDSQVTGWAGRQLNSDEAELIMDREKLEQLESDEKLALEIAEETHETIDKYGHLLN